MAYIPIAKARGFTPRMIIKKGAALEREMKAASKEQETAHKEWERLNQKIDKMLNRADDHD